MAPANSARSSGQCSAPVNKKQSATTPPLLKRPRISSAESLHCAIYLALLSKLLNQCCLVFAFREHESRQETLVHSPMKMISDLTLTVNHEIDDTAIDVALQIASPKENVVQNAWPPKQCLAIQRTKLGRCIARHLGASVLPAWQSDAAAIEPITRRVVIVLLPS